MAIRLGGGVDLEKCHPYVFAAIVEELQEMDKQAKTAAAKEKLRGAVGR